MHERLLSRGALALVFVIGFFFLLGPMETDVHAKKRKYQKCDLSSESAKCKSCGTKFEESKLNFAAYMKKAKKLKCFDDIGCMFRFREQNCTSTQMELDHKIIVRDYSSQEEVAVAEAFFVVHSGVNTPQGHAIIAFGDKAAAEKFSSGVPGSSVMDFDTISETKFKELIK